MTAGRAEINRRRFLRNACGALAMMMIPAGAARPSIATRRAEVRRRKVIIVVFGGGTRYSESVGDPEHRYIPRLWQELIPRGTLFTDVQVEGRVVHTNCTASLLTGHRE